MATYLSINEIHNSFDACPFTTITSRQVYDNPWVTLNEDNVLLPSGRTSIYGRVHFKNLSVGIIPLDSEANTWLVGQYRYPIKSYSWEIPMGGGLLDTDPLKSAKRELREETGLIANRWERLLTLHTSNSVTDETGIVYLATELEQGKPFPDDSEVLSICRVSLTEALEMVMQNKITEAISVSSLLFLAHKIRN
jgi:8-oxo-dGTP pyrophosphatase MutT (NUDIX family)